MNYFIESQIIPALTQSIGDENIGKYYFGKPEEIASEELDKGVIFVRPISSQTRPEATGMLKADVYTISVNIAVSHDRFANKDAETDNAENFCVRILEGQDDSGNLNINSVRYFIWNLFRQWGMRIPDDSITYNSKEYTHDNVYTASMTLVIERQVYQSIQ